MLRQILLLVSFGIASVPTALGDVAATGADSNAPRPRISVEDLVRFAAIGNPQLLTWKGSQSQLSPDAALLSPDKKHVAVVVRRGHTERKTNDASLLIYRADQLFEGGQPEILAEFSSATNYQPIALVRWLADSQALIFAGTRAEQPSQIYRANVNTGAIDQLTRMEDQITWYDNISSGNKLVTLSEPDSTPLAEDRSCIATGCRVTAATLASAQRGLAQESSASLTYHDLTTGKVRSIQNPEQSDTQIEHCDPDLAGGLSPDGRFVFRTCKLRASALPELWNHYTAVATIRACMAVKNSRCFRRGVLIDLESGQTFPIEPDAPFRATPIWIEGGRYALLPGTLQSLVDDEERAVRSASLAVLLLDTHTRELRRIAVIPSGNTVSAAKWDELTQSLTVEMRHAKDDKTSLLIARRKGARWLLRSAEGQYSTPEAQPVLQFTIEQSLNDPPMLVAKRGNKRREILDPNPWLTQRTLGWVESISWRSKSGAQWQGGLFYPPNYTPGARYPLLLQTNGFKPNRFSLQGISRNFPGQALAAHDIFVLQVEEQLPQSDTSVQPTAWPAIQAGYEGAIDDLDARGLIDGTRVGIQGWSFTGNTTGYTLTHSQYRFVAAAFTNTADVGWLWYLAAGAPRDVAASYGAEPFGDGLNAWMKYSPSFNLQRVNAPMLMMAEGAPWILWDWYAGLRYLEKPVEYWVSPDVTHDVFKISQRLQRTELLVDWFRFWLKAEEDDVPAKQHQYERWRQFRDDR